MGLFYFKFYYFYATLKSSIMEKIYHFVLDTLHKAIRLSLTFLCLGVIVQLLIDDDLLNWDPVGNIQDAGSSFIGVISLVVLYLLFKKK